ncbi:hypothetical protein V8C42DRAFT_211234 [Trichoderma barbatum]
MINAPILLNISIESADILVPVSDEHYHRAVDVVKQYQKQAVNMTADEQNEYKALFDDKCYVIEQSAIGAPSNHRLYKACKFKPTWAKYVFLHGLYHSTAALDIALMPHFHSLAINDMTEQYRQHCPAPAPARAPKRKATTTGGRRRRPGTAPPAAAPAPAVEPSGNPLAPTPSPAPQPVPPTSTPVPPPVPTPAPLTPAPSPTPTPTPQAAPPRAPPTRRPPTEQPPPPYMPANPFAGPVFPTLTNPITMAAMNQRMNNIEAAITSQNQVNAAQWRHMHARLTLVISEVTDMREESSNCEVTVETQLPPGFETGFARLVDTVDAIARVVGIDSATLPSQIVTVDDD